jgi:hypothetical protein
MKRRDVIVTFGRAATLPLLWPLAAQSQQSARTYRLATGTGDRTVASTTRRAKHFAHSEIAAEVQPFA